MTGVLNYATSPGPHTVGGYVFSGLEGAGIGALTAGAMHYATTGGAAVAEELTPTGGTRLSTIRPVPRDPKDIAISAKPKTPDPIPWQGRTIGNTPAQNQEVQAVAQDLHNRGAQDIRIDQHQVNIHGQRVGINRPDLQYTFNSRRYYVEWDRATSARGPEHASRIHANDPDGIIELRTVG